MGRLNDLVPNAMVLRFYSRQSNEDNRTPQMADNPVTDDPGYKD
jgi:hypothetical protein